MCLTENPMWEWAISNPYSAALTEVTAKKTRAADSKNNFFIFLIPFLI
jgi:hypothetical protein